jgi:hypothetical protein
MVMNEPPSARCAPSLVLTARLRTDYAVIRAVHATFRYHAADPLAVRFEFGDPDIGSVSWVIGRQQLLEGVLHGFSAGAISIQEVTVLSANGAPEPTMLRLTLHGIGARAVLEMKADPVRTWLAETFTAVPAGTEGGTLDWDGFLARAAGGSPLPPNRWTAP